MADRKYTSREKCGVSIQCLNALGEWNTAFARKNGVSLYNARKLENRIVDVRRFKKLIINQEDDFIRYFSELNEIINENIATAEVVVVLEPSLSHDKTEKCLNAIIDVSGMVIYM